jgi:hypothetical protein
MGRSQRPKRKRDGGGGDDLDKGVVNFFEKLISEKDFKVDTPISSDTRLFFKTFFDAFNKTKVEINKDDIGEKKYKAGVFDHMNKKIKQYVDETMAYTYTYSTFIGRKVNMEISFHEKQTKDNVSKYISMMVFWLQIVAMIATEPCNEPLQITLFLSKLKKILLGKCSTKSCVIDNTSINTGYSTRCSEIVIFREEEWFKVFVHETFHNFGLDFSWSQHYYNGSIKSFFNITINKDIKLFEAYTEALARIINVLLLTYDAEKTNFEKFVSLANTNMLLERANSYFQSNKILNYKGLDMDNLTSYDEQTASFSYYIIVAILYSDYQDFISWCINNNTKHHYIQFDLSNLKEKQRSFCDFIKSRAGRSSTFRKDLQLYKQRFFSKRNGTSTSDDYLNTYMKKSILSRSLVA